MISEFFYDAVGSDDGLSFVELYGTPGASLTGLFVEGVNGANGAVLWRTDGTYAGTYMAQDIYPGASGFQPYSSSPGHLTSMNGTLYFTANAALHGR